jgi:hypothetical protein
VFQEVYSLARAVILVSSDSDAPKSFQYSPDMGPARLVKVSASISSRDLFNAIQSIIGKLKPLNAPKSQGGGKSSYSGKESPLPSAMPGDLNRQPSVVSDIGRDMGRVSTDAIYPAATTSGGGGSSGGAGSGGGGGGMGPGGYSREQMRSHSWRNEEEEDDRGAKGFCGTYYYCYTTAILLLRTTTYYYS